MTREDFEEWLEDHKDEALGRIEREEMSLAQWIKLFGKSLRILENEEEEEEDEEDEEENYAVEDDLGSFEEDM